MQKKTNAQADGNTCSLSKDMATHARSTIPNIAFLDFQIKKPSKVIFQNVKWLQNCILNAPPRHNPCGWWNRQTARQMPQDVKL